MIYLRWTYMMTVPLDWTLSTPALHGRRPVGSVESRWLPCGCHASGSQGIPNRGLSAAVRRLLLCGRLGSLLARLMTAASEQDSVLAVVPDRTSPSLGDTGGGCPVGEGGEHMHFAERPWVSQLRELSRRNMEHRPVHRVEPRGSRRQVRKIPSGAAGEMISLQSALDAQVPTIILEAFQAALSRLPFPWQIMRGSQET